MQNGAVKRVDISEAGHLRSSCLDVSVQKQDRKVVKNSISFKFYDGLVAF